MKNIIALILLVCSSASFGQIGVNTSNPDSSSILHLNSDKKGLLPPRMQQVSRDNIANPATGLLIYQTNNFPGYYYNAGTPSTPQWQGLVSGVPGSGNFFKIPIDTLPYTVSQPGSYILTKNLTAGSGIIINANNVSIDLNHYSLTGMAGNASSGILINAVGSNVSVFNGFIDNWGEDGISALNASGFQAFNLNLRNNAGDGLICGQNCIVAQCIATGNDLDGFDLGNNGTISQCISSANGDTGIECDSRCLVKDCIVTANGDQGVFTLSECIISGVTSYQNTHYGIRAGNHNKLMGNVASSNGFAGYYLSNASFAENNLAKLNAQHGYEAGQDVSLVNNTADSNTGNGFYSSFNGGKMDGNNSTDNSNGFEISGSDWLITRNTASGNAVSAFAVSGTNKIATIITGATLNSNSNPFANISY